MIPISAFSQSPWTQKKGKFYTQLSFTTIPNYDTLFDNPDYSNFGTYYDNTIQFFAEYSLSDNTTLVINIPLKLISLTDFEDPRIDCAENCSKNYNNTSLGNIEIGLKHNFIKKIGFFLVKYLWKPTRVLSMQFQEVEQAMMHGLLLPYF